MVAATDRAEPQSGGPLMMSYEEYAALPAVRAGDLAALAKSPLRYRWQREHPTDSASLRLGRAAHTAILEPHKYAREYAVYGGRRDARHKAYQSFLAAHPTATILSPDEDRDAREMAAAVHGHPVAHALLSDGVAERTFTTTDHATGIPIKVRLDFLRRRPAAIVDLKTTRSIAPRKFSGQAWDLAYHVKLALYHDVVAAVLGFDLPVWIVAVESADEHDVACYECVPAWLQHGRDKARTLLDRLAECQRTDTWPGMAPEPLILEPPRWAEYEAEGEGGVE